jgi:asparagine synthase (glutamine-hydrolysing)
MCGIAGWVGWGPDLTKERDIVRAMTETMACRGPDAEGLWLEPNAVLGHRRLAVLDIEGGKQPMAAQGGRGESAVITFSGEIYNFSELKRDLVDRGHQFSTRHSDTEVLLRSYLEWGDGCVARLNGMFAFAIWDTARQELLLGRDRLGVKPLFYAMLADGLLFASEPKAILRHPLITAEVDAEGLGELFAVAGARTPGHAVYRGLRELLPGHTMRVNRAGVQTDRYWRLESRPHPDDLATTVRTVRELLTDIVERQLVSDVPVCTLLSGGIDSSALTALAAHVTSDKIASFSVNFRDNEDSFAPDLWRPTMDEPFVRMVAEHVGLMHSTVTLDSADLFGAIDVPLRARDLPGWGDLDISLYLMLRDIRKHATVALSGESADEMFGGYPWFSDEAKLAADTFPWTVGKPEPAEFLRPEVRDLIRPQEYAADRYAEALTEVPALDGEDDRARRRRIAFYLGLTRWLPALLDRKDRISMLLGLEVRVPFCDHRLVEYLWNVPWEMKTAGGIEKGLLRSAVDDLLPAEVVRRRKSAYPATQDRRFDDSLREELSDLLADPSARLFDLVDRDKLRSALRRGESIPGPSCAPGKSVGLAYFLDINRWLSAYDVRLRV